MELKAPRKIALSFRLPSTYQKRLCLSSLHSFFYKNVVFPAQPEYSYLSADFRLKIFLYYSKIIAYDISVLECWGINYKCSVSAASAGFFVLLA